MTTADQTTISQPAPATRSRRKRLPETVENLPFDRSRYSQQTLDWLAAGCPGWRRSAGGPTCNLQPVTCEPATGGA